MSHFYSARLTRRRFLAATPRALGLVTGLAGLGAGALGAYGLGVEPAWMLNLTHYAPDPPGWPRRMRLTIAVLADLHIAEPDVSAARLASIVARTNAQKPDLIVLLGDYVCTHPFVSAYVAPEIWADQLAALSAPLGTFAILGNHDWWSAAMPTMAPDGSASVRRALERARIPLLENSAVRLAAQDAQGIAHPFWLAGLGDQLAHVVHRSDKEQTHDGETARFAQGNGKWHGRGVDNLAGTLSQMWDDAPAIMLAHEPFVFEKIPARVALTLCGHTHGGQVRLPLVGVPWTPHGMRTPYMYGHFQEGGRDLIVSGGIGTSIVPVRIGVPPEIVFVHLGKGNGGYGAMQEELPGSARNDGF